MDDDKEITLTLAQLHKVMNLRPPQRIRFWVGMTKEITVSEILEKIEANQPFQKK